MPNKEYRDAFHACSAQALIEDRGRRRLQKEQERRERIEDAVEANEKSTLPVVEELKSIVESLQEQNGILQSQIDEANKDGEEAKKEALHSRVFNWITFGVTTAFSAAALVISIIALSINSNMSFNSSKFSFNSFNLCA